MSARRNSGKKVIKAGERASNAQSALPAREEGGIQTGDTPDDSPTPEEIASVAKRMRISLPQTRPSASQVRPPTPPRNFSRQVRRPRSQSIDRTEAAPSSAAPRYFLRGRSEEPGSARSGRGRTTAPSNDRSSVKMSSSPVPGPSQTQVLRRAVENRAPKELDIYMQLRVEAVIQDLKEDANLERMINGHSWIKNFAESLRVQGERQLASDEDILFWINSRKDIFDPKTIALIVAEGMKPKAGEAVKAPAINEPDTDMSSPSGSSSDGGDEYRPPAGRFRSARSGSSNVSGPGSKTRAR